MIFIQISIGAFGRLLLWENDLAHLARLIVKAKVTELEAIPHFIVFFEAVGFQGECRTVQCEILEERMLGALPADEEHVHVPNAAGQPPVYDFLSRSATSNALSPSNQCSW
jgi:hypothetical protein